MPHKTEVAIDLYQFAYCGAFHCQGENKFKQDKNEAYKQFLETHLLNNVFMKNRSLDSLKVMASRLYKGRYLE